jgi:hypothetical protein
VWIKDFPALASRPSSIMALIVIESDPASAHNLKAIEID